MSGARALLIVLSIFLISKSDASLAQSRSPGTATKYCMKRVQKFVKSIVSSPSKKLGEYLLQRFLPSNSFTIMVTNNMRQNHMINPTIYLETGKTSTPPPFRIPAAREECSREPQLVIFDENPKGVLCYHSVSNEYILKEILCVLFEANGKYDGKYSVVREIISDFSTKKAERVFKTKNKAIQEHKGWFQSEWNTYSLITTGPTKKLYFEVRDKNSVISLMDDIVTPEKREISILGVIPGTFGNGILNPLASYITKKLMKDVVTTLTIENVSSDPSIVLKNPRWVKNGVYVRDIIPRRLSSKQSCVVRLEAPFVGGDTFLGSFKKSFIVLSFLIEGTDYRLILLLWNRFNSHAVFLDQTLKEESQLDLHLQNFIKTEAQRSVIKTENLQSHSFWHFPDNVLKNGRKFVHVVTYLGNADTSVMTMKVYATNFLGKATAPKGDAVLAEEYNGGRYRMMRLLPGLRKNN